MSKHTIRGSFFVNGEKCFYPSQQELADGWRVVLPNYKRKKTENISQKPRKKNKEIYNEVTLAQLPPHLYPKFLERNAHSTNVTIYDGNFKFRVIETQYDDMIQELYKLVFVKNPSVNQKEKMRELVEVLEANHVSGWLIIRAKDKSL